MKVKNEEGITLVALVVTVVLLVILASVGIKAGTNHFKNIKLKSFYTKLEIATEGVEKIYNTNESYKDDEGNIVYLKNLGTAPTPEQSSLITSISETYDTSKFKYFTAEQVEQDLEISGVDLDLLINFETQIVISAEPLVIDGTSYYTLESTKYKVSLDNSKNMGDPNSNYNPNFTYNVVKYGSDSYKITVTPINIGDINEGIVEYKKTTSSYWTVSEDNVIIINALGNYDIKYTDANNNSVTKTISISLDNEENVISNEINE